MQSTRITAVRHGETDWNQSGRIQGHTDVLLNARGMWQARQVACALQDEAFDALYSSDLQRAWQTAQSLSEQIRHAPVPQPELRERAFGVLEGHTATQIAEQFPDIALPWQQRDLHFTPEHGESLLDLHERVLQGVAHLAQAHVDAHIVLVTHGGVLDILYRHATGQGLDAPRTWTIENASIHRFLWSPDAFTLLAWGDIAHLEDGPATLALDEGIA